MATEIKEVELEYGERPDCCGQHKHTQLAAAESAIKAVSRIILKEHLETCVVERVQAGDTEVVDEVMDLLKKFGA